MSEMTKFWLEQLYANEIEEVKGTISNEKCFMMGAKTIQEMEMHEQNIKNFQEYLETLEELKEGVA